MTIFFIIIASFLIVGWLVNDACKDHARARDEQERLDFEQDLRTEMAIRDCYPHISKEEIEKRVREHWQFSKEWTKKYGY